jgi:hypothetical protein
MISCYDRPLLRFFATIRGGNRGGGAPRVRH